MSSGNTAHLWLCCYSLLCSMLCCAVLNWAVMCQCVILFHQILICSILISSVLSCSFFLSFPFCPVLCCLFCSALFHAVQLCSVRFSSVLLRPRLCLALLFCALTYDLWSLTRSCGIQQESGLASWIGGHLQPLARLPPAAAVMLITAFLACFTEFASNTATIIIFLPVIAELVRAGNLFEWLEALIYNKIDT